MNMIRLGLAALVRTEKSSWMKKMTPLPKRSMHTSHNDIYRISNVVPNSGKD